MMKLTKSLAASAFLVSKTTVSSLSWASATTLFESTLDDRLKKDHRARKSHLVGLYEMEGAASDILISIQPVAGGRHLQFAHGETGERLGHIGLTADSTAESSLMGMVVNSNLRGAGLSKTFIEIWLMMCEKVSERC